MIRNPFNMFPNNNTLDGTLANTFSFTVSANRIIAYTINIFENNNFSLVASSGKQYAEKFNNDVVTHTFIPNTFRNSINYTWNVELEEDQPSTFVTSGSIVAITSPSQLTIRADGSANNYTGMFLTVNGEQRRIESYNYDTGVTILESPFTTLMTVGNQYLIHKNTFTSRFSFFQARTTPQISIVGLTEVINSRKYEFVGEYIQAENTSLKYFIFNIYNEAGGLVNTSGRVFSSNIRYSFEGFLPRAIHSVELVVETQDSVIVSTGRIMFRVSYPEPQLNTIPVSTLVCDQNAIKTTWDGVNYTTGQADGNYEIINGEAYLPEGTTLSYNNINGEVLSLDGPFIVMLKTRMGSSFTGKIIELISGYYVSFDGNKFTYTKDGNTFDIFDLYLSYEGLISDTDEVTEGVKYIWDDDQTWLNELWCVEGEELSLEDLRIAMTNEMFEVGKEVKMSLKSEDSLVVITNGGLD